MALCLHTENGLPVFRTLSVMYSAKKSAKQSRENVNVWKLHFSPPGVVSLLSIKCNKVISDRCVGTNTSYRLLKPNTHRRRDETVELRRVGGVNTPSAVVTQFTVSYADK